MRHYWFGLAAIAGMIPCALAGAGAVSGDYLEVRTCSIYTGACHANGEAVTEGREAILAWRISHGELAGAAADGLSAVSVVEGPGNLGLPGAARRSVVYVDERASAAQRSALAAALAARYAGALGDVVAVRPARIDFQRHGLEYALHIPGLVEVRTTRYPCEHCIMPHAVWYDPFIPVRGGLVAQAEVNRFAGCAELPVSWLRRDENSSYTGTFAL